jgi:putative flippase GtrA
MKLPIQFIIYLIVGGWNTLFGIGLYAVCYHLFGGQVHYLVIAVPVNIVAITNAYICYKVFVFKTCGNYLHEYLKCFLVYGVGALVAMGLLWVLVTFAAICPDWANLFATGFVAVVSYFGHKYFSFRQPVKSHD